MREHNGWISWKYLVLNGRMRKQIKFPTRERFLAKIAVSKLGYKFMEIVPFYNPLYNGNKNQYSGSIQWIDFLIYVPRIKKMIAIQFEAKSKSGGVHKRTKDVLRTKIEYLKQKGIPTLVIAKHLSSQEYEMLIRMFIAKLEKQ